MPHQDAKIRLVMDLRREGISDVRVLAAIERLPREAFVPESERDFAYVNEPLPIGGGQTISQPLVVAAMTEALRLTDRHKVLEIGTGSGYQTAVLAQLCRRVYTIERDPRLLAAAEARFANLRLTNITSRLGDGRKGWPEQAPFDRVIVTAAAEEVPGQIVAQLKDGGILLVPVGPRGGYQRLVKVVRRGEDVEETDLFPVSFVALRKGVPGNGAVD